MYRGCPRTCPATLKWTQLQRLHAAYQRVHSKVCQAIGCCLKQTCLVQLPRHLNALVQPSAISSIHRQQSLRYYVAAASVAGQKTTSLKASPSSLKEVAQSYPVYGSYGEHVPAYFHDPQHAQVAVRQALDMLDRHVTASTTLISAADTLHVYQTSFKVDGLEQIDMLSSEQSSSAAEQIAWAQLFVNLHNDGILANALEEHNFDPDDGIEALQLNHLILGRAMCLSGIVPEITFHRYVWKRQVKPDDCHWLVSLSIPDTSRTPIYRSNNDRRIAELLAVKRFEHLVVHHSKSLSDSDPLWSQLPSMSIDALLKFLQAYTSRKGNGIAFECKNGPYGAESWVHVTMLLDGEMIGRQSWYRARSAVLMLRLKLAISIIKRHPDLWMLFLNRYKKWTDGTITSLELFCGQASESANDTPPIVHPTISIDKSNIGGQIQKPLILLDGSNTFDDGIQITSPILSADVRAAPGEDTAIITNSEQLLQVYLDPSTLVSMQQGLVAAQKANMLVAEGTPPKAAPTMSLKHEKHRRSLPNPMYLIRSASLKREQLAFLRKQASNPLQRQRYSLPIFQRKNQIIKMIHKHACSIIVGGTGCGKSTQVPQLILDRAIDTGRGALCKIICTQPRRIAALSLARRVANERDERLGSSVGYHVRYERVRPRSFGCIEYLTTGMLLEKLGTDSDLVLSDVSHIVIDEAHERDVNIDFLMLALKRLSANRGRASKSMPKIILMSATLEVDLFAKYWSINGKPCPSLTIPGKLFPVERQYLEDVMGNMDDGGSVLDELRSMYPIEAAAAESYLDQEMNLVQSLPGVQEPSAPDLASVPQVPILLVVAAICRICDSSAQGAILVFLPGMAEIGSVQIMLETSDFANNASAEVLQLHSSLSKEEQLLIFQPLTDERRRIILSTNIAETSVTVPHVRFVIDSGIIRERRYDADSKATSLAYAWQSQSSSLQRMGRAGRLEAGHYLALFTKSRFDSMHKSGVPELLRTNLSSLALSLKARFPEAQIGDLFGDALQTPDLDSIEAAQTDLKAMKALDMDGNLTMLGSVLSQLPLEPRWAKVVLLGILFKCLDAVLIIATSMQTELFIQPFRQHAHVQKIHKQFDSSQSDHLAVWTAYSELRRLQAQRGSEAAKSFASQNFLAWRAYETIQKDAAVIERLLQASGLIRPEANMPHKFRLHGGDALNSNNDYHEIVKCLVLTGFPNNLAAYHRGHSWRIGRSKSRIHSTSLVSSRATGEVSRSRLTLRLFTSLTEGPESEVLCMRHVSSLEPLGGLLFCDQLRTDAGSLRINELQPVHLEFAPDNATEVVLQYKKLLDQTIGNALQDMGKNNWEMNPDVEDFIQHLVELMSTARPAFARRLQQAVQKKPDGASSHDTRQSIH